MTNNYVIQEDPEEDLSCNDTQARHQSISDKTNRCGSNKVLPETETKAVTKGLSLNKEGHSFDSRIQVDNIEKTTAHASRLKKKKEKHEVNFLSVSHQGRRTSAQLIDDNLNSILQVASIHSKCKSWFVPAETAANLKMFGGIRAIQEEQMRSRNAGWIIHPYSSLRYYWDLIIMLALLVNLVVLPLNIAFFTMDGLNDWVVFHSCSDVLFILDIILNFRTGYREEQNGYRMVFVLEPKLIAKRYARSWLVLDVISSLPIDNIILLLSGHTNDLSLGVKSASRAFKFLRITKFLSLLKLLRLSKVLRYISRFEQFYHVTASVMRYIKLILMMLLVAHWNGCLGFLVPMMQDFPDKCWIRLNGLQDSHWSEQYGWALFKALSHMLCIGYGRFIPQLLSEASITIFSMVTGATFYALFIAHSMAYIQQNDSARRQYQEKFQQIEEYMSYRNLPNSTRERIQDYYEHKYTQKRLFDENEILSEVSKPIRNDIVNYNCRDLIESVPFLKGGQPDFLTLIINKLTFDVYLSGDVIIKEGTIGDEMYFIRQGVVDVIVEDQNVATLTEGEYFGEITMLTDARRVASVKAASVCDLFILTKDNLYLALEEFPEMRTVMEHVAIDRLIKLKQKFPNCVNTQGAHSDLEYRHSNNDMMMMNNNSRRESLDVNVSTASSGFVYKSKKVHRPSLVARAGRTDDLPLLTIVDTPSNVNCDVGCTCEMCSRDQILT